MGVFKHATLLPRRRYGNEAKMGNVLKPQIQLALQLVPLTSAEISRSTVSTVSPAPHWDASGYSYVEPKGSVSETRPVRAPRLFASSGDETGAAGSAPPPPPGAGSNDDGSGSDAKPGWSFLPSLKAPPHERLYTIRQMSSADEIAQSVLIDLTDIGREGDQLRYMEGVAETVDEFLHSGGHLDHKDMVGAIHMIARAADELTGFITLERAEMTAGLVPARATMRWLTKSADHLERMLLGGGEMDRETAGRLADIYLVTAVKGANSEAHMSRRSDGINSLEHRAHIGKTFLQLIDVMDRYKMLGREDDAEMVRGILYEAAARHGFPQSIKSAREAAVDLLRSKIEYIYGSSDPSVRSEREAVFLRSLRYIIDGNRRFAPFILLDCQDIFLEIGDDVRRKRMNMMMRNETVLTDSHSKI